MDKWTELRTAFKLAKLGTLSATAAEIGVHRSTVMRHIDVLEQSLGVVLFQRNDKGYLPTEAGLEMMRLGEITDEQFLQLSQRLQNKEAALTGTLTITTVDDLASTLLPLINRYQSLHPQVRINVLGDLRNFKLEYGEADIAIRMGPKPQTPDNIVLPLFTTEIGLCAHQDYLAQHSKNRPLHGNQALRESLAQHKFMALNERSEHLPWNEWLHNHIPAENITLTSSSNRLLSQAILSGNGIGAMPVDMIKANADLVDLTSELAQVEHWQIPAWILVHRDIFHMPKIKHFIELLKQQPLALASAL